MNVFMISACIALLSILLINLIHIKREKDGWVEVHFFKQHWLSLKIEHRIYLFSGYFILLITIAIIIILLFGYLADESHFSYLYGFYSVLTSQTAYQIMIGLIFGALFGVWAVRMYKLPPTDDGKMPIAQKFEGIGLLVIFVVGISSIPIDQYIRAISFKDGKFNFQLSTALQGPISFDRSDKENAGRLQGVKGVKNISGEPGFILASVLDSLLTREADYIAARYNISNNKSDPKLVKAVDRISNLKKAGKVYAKNFGEYAKCIAALANVFRGDHQFRGYLTDLRPEIQYIAQLQNYYLKNKNVSNEKREELDRYTKEVVGRLSEKLKRKSKILYEISQKYLAIGEADESIDRRCSKLDTATYGISDLIPNNVRNRPYLAVLLAGILQLEGREPAGIQALRDWWRAYKSIPGIREDPAFPWYEIRILSTQVWLFNTMFERQEHQPSVLRNDYLNTLSYLIRKIHSFEEVEKVYKTFFYKPRRDVTKKNATSDSGVRSSCPEELDFKVPKIQSGIRLSIALLSMQAAFVRNSIENRRIRLNRIPRVKDMVDQVVDANYDCYIKFLDRSNPNGSDQYIAYVRSDRFLTYALFMQAFADARKPIGTKAISESLGNYRTSLNALRLASSIIEPYGKPKNIDLSTGDIQMTRYYENEPARKLWDKIEIEKERLERVLELKR